MSRNATGAEQAVLEAAVKVFARRGYAGASVESLLAATGLSKPTLYYYFNSKAGLFRAIVGFALDECHRLMAEAVGRERDGQAELTAMADALFKFTLQHEDLMRLVFATVFAAPGELPPKSIDPAKRRRNFELVQSVMERAQKAGEFSRDFHAAELAHGFFGALSHHVRYHLLNHTHQLDAQRAARLVELFLAGARK